MLLIVNLHLQFSEFSKNGVQQGHQPCCAPTFLWFGYLAQSGHSEKWVSTQVGHVIFSNQFGQTKIEDLVICSEIWKIRSTERLSFYFNLLQYQAIKDFDICQSLLFNHVKQAH